MSGTQYVSVAASARHENSSAGPNRFAVLRKWDRERLQRREPYSQGQRENPTSGTACSAAPPPGPRDSRIQSGFGRNDAASLHTGAVGGRGRASVKALADRIRRGEPRALARALSAVENRSDGADELLSELHDPNGAALRIGITGPPGAGKSTLVDCIVRHLRRDGASVGILAVDPSSPFTGGAILGDRVRMQRHHGDPGVFIRSMASRGQLGGLAPAVGDALVLLEAAGRDAVLIETAGVGQSEVDVVQLAGTVAVVLTPAAGDDIQAAKAGIMEVADLFVINKADQPGADELERQILAVTSLIPPGKPKPPVLRTSALRGEGIGELVEALQKTGHTPSDPAYWKRLLVKRLEGELQAMLLDETALGEDLDRAARAIAAGELNPYAYTQEILGRFKQQWKQ